MQFIIQYPPISLVKFLQHTWQSERQHWLSMQCNTFKSLLPTFIYLVLDQLIVFYVIQSLGLLLFGISEKCDDGLASQFGHVCGINRFWSTESYFRQ